jgi:hypothetical protein
MLGGKSYPASASPTKKLSWYYRSIADRFREVLPGQLSNELPGVAGISEGNAVAVNTA